MKVKFFATFRGISGCESFETPAPDNLHALLKECCERWPAFRTILLDESGKKLGPALIIMVNGRHIQHLDGIKTKLKDTDVVAITPQMAGG